MKQRASTPTLGQDNAGLKRALTFSSVYTLFQRLVGGDARRWIAQNFWRLEGGEKVVDMGCGPGDAFEFMPHAVEYWGFDISEEYIGAARLKHPSANFIAGPVSDLAGDPRLRGADLVLSNGLLHHLSDDEALEALRLAKGVLKEGGRLVCLEAARLERQGRLSRWVVSRDRGQFVRTERQWKALVGQVFDSYSTDILTGLTRIPYTHIVIECRNVNTRAAAL
jgi:SAM-dependent methyltransferase